MPYTEKRFELELCANMPYVKTMELCKAYHWIGDRKANIIEYFFELEYFEGNFCDVTKAMGYSLGKKKISKTGKEYYDSGQQSNILKEIQILNRLGVIYIGYHEDDYIDEEGTVKRNAKPKVMFLVDGWMENLINSYHRYKDKIPNPTANTYYSKAWD